MLPIFAGFSQIAYVTTDLDMAFRVFADEYGIPEFYRLPAEFDIVSGGKHGRVALDIGFANIGPLQLELIEPKHGLTDFYAAPLPGDGSFGLVLHHSGVRTTGTLEEWRRTRAEIAAEGREVALEGEIPDVAAFAYVDERKLLGLYIEHFWFSDAVWERRDRRIPRYSNVR
jgi:hypothetical protein